MAARAAAVSPARGAAFDVLLRVFEDEAYADRAFRSAVSKILAPYESKVAACREPDA